ncbi:MAG TPA: zinc-ribbon domain-containing protein [Terriglobales bacterium]|nr:zinc-ribbon domain-containing protein [Terriglobales bacterium]
MRFCPQCGQAAQDQYKFCMQCGSDVSSIPAVGPATFPAPLFPPATPDKVRARTVWIIVGGLLAVVGLPTLLIVAAIVIPNIMDERISRNESSALQNVKKLNHALTVYHDTYRHGYPAGLALLGPRASGAPDEFGAALVDAPSTQPEQSGYRFSYEARALDAAGHATGFVLYVDPVSPNQGRQHFYLDQSGVIRGASTTASPESSPIDNPQGESCDL